MALTLKQLVLSGLTTALVLHSACAQQEDLKKSYESKIAEDWFVKGGWSDDYDAVRARAKEEGKIIFAYFSRTYAP
jgi:hypothetical protein